MNANECRPDGAFRRRNDINRSRVWPIPLIVATSLVATCTGKDATAPTTTPPPVSSVSVTPATAAVHVGQTVQLTATTKDASGDVLAGRTVVWVCSNIALATVNGSGLVTGVAAGGPVTITATSEGQSGTAAVTVSPPPVASVAVAPVTATVTVGQTVQLTATTKDANGNVLTGRTVTWVSGNPALATVNGSGLVTGVALGGPVIITATSEGQSGAAAVTVSAVPVASVMVAPTTATVQVGQAVQLTATTKDANGNVLTGRTVTWASSAPTVATVSGTGVVTGVAAGGPVTITATSEGQSGTAAITVVPVPVASVTVAPAAATIQIGQTVKLSATTKDASGNVLTGRPVTWASGTPTVATVSGTGVVTGVASGGPVTITATSEGQSGTAAITVTPPSGDLYVSTIFDGSVWHYDVTGQLVRSVVSNLGTLSVGGLAFGSDCNLYVGLANPLSASAAVAVFSGATDAPLRLFVPFIAAGSQPGPIAFGSDGSLYVATQNPDAVLRYDATGQLVHTFLLPVPATDMTASNGIVYVSTGASTAVFSIDVQTATVTTFVDVSVGTPVGITFDGAGNFYAVQTVVSSILPTLSGVLRFTGPGVPGQPFVSSDPRLNGGLGEATDLAFGGDGNLYVLSVHGNALLRYHGTDGTFDQAFAAIPASGLAGGPWHLAFKPLTCH